jgi:hypothetical protein
LTQPEPASALSEALGTGMVPEPDDAPSGGGAAEHVTLRRVGGAVDRVDRAADWRGAEV